MRFEDRPRLALGPALNGFMAGPENRLANVALHDVLQQGANRYGLLHFYGPSGSGKTHLARGLVRWWETDHRDSPAFLLSGGEFCEQYAEAVSTRRAGVCARNAARLACL